VSLKTHVYTLTVLIKVFQIDIARPIKYGVRSYPMRTGFMKHSCGESKVTE